MSESKRRKAANEAVFRAVNEQIKELQRPSAVAEGESLDIVCECDRLDCVDPLTVDLETYERVRGDSTLFLIAPGHEDDSIEDVVDTGNGYVIVRKRPGEPQQIAEQTDLRA